jgi:hypothetical protein
MAFYGNFKRKYFLTTSSFSNFKEGLRLYRPVSVVGFIKKASHTSLSDFNTCNSFSNGNL